MSLTPHCIFKRGSGPIVAAAIHDGHDTRKKVERHMAINDLEQLREEDPITAEWTQVAKTQIIGLRSRFEVDLNRPRDKAVYLTPADAWGIQVWKSPPDQKMIDASLAQYDQFYRDVEVLLREMVAEHGYILLYDLHTYNHRRDGANGPMADANQNPEVNIGTGTMDRTFWAPVVDRFIDSLRAYDFHGRSLDVRENVKFQGGEFGRWIHQTFPKQVCAIAIEFKKFFMDEWTGEVYQDEVECIYKALESTLPSVRDALSSMAEF